MELRAGAGHPGLCLLGELHQFEGSFTLPACRSRRVGPHRKPDKRRCVEIALREWPKLSNPIIAELCGVGINTVLRHRPDTNLANGQVELRIGRDGKERPVTRRPEYLYAYLPLFFCLSEKSSVYSTQFVVKMVEIG